MLRSRAPLEPLIGKHFATTFVSKLLTSRSEGDFLQGPAGPVVALLKPNHEVTMPGDEMLVRDLMTADVFTVDRNEALLTANRVMNLGRIRHVIVVDDEGEVAGVLSQRDLFHSGLMKALGYGTHAMNKTLDTLLVKEVMTTNPLTTNPDTPLSQAAAMMFAQKIGCLPVVEGRKLVGILTESDFVKLHSR